MFRKRLVRFVAVSGLVMMVFAVVLGVVLSSALAADEAGGGTAAAPAASPARGLVAIAMAISVAAGVLGAGYAVAKVGSAAIGATSERPEMMGRAIVFVGLAEGLAIIGFVGAILLYKYL